MTIEAVTHYRLTIATGRAATTFCITADTDSDANRKAVAIARSLNLPTAKIELTTRDLSVGKHLVARLFEPRAASYWGA